MSSVKKYNEARIFMFKNNPPDFYRAPNFCNQKELPLPSFIKDDYTRLNKENHPSCIYVKNERLKSISKNQISELLKWKYTIPK
ncbi:MAG TPA: hypothetical protein VES68_02985, partial [Candidatus Sulfotelmatobacter sp.]|nr:hypothetical protein [Candidatus Sulfotelmatobacter sp.]